MRTIALSLVAAALAGGCLVAYKRDRGPDRLDDDTLAMIGPGLPRGVVLDRLGPPDAIVRPGGTGPDPALELFAGRGRSLEGRCVYLYQSDSASEVGGAVLLASASSRKRTKRRLWVLVNEVTGVVEDSVLRED